MKDKELSGRLASISPEKRALLKSLLEEEGMAIRPGVFDDTAGSSPEGEAVPAEEDLETTASHDTGPSSLRSKWDWSDKVDKTVTRRAYDRYHAKCDSTIFGQHSFFMNLGYVPNDNDQHSPIELPAHVANKHSIKLALEVIGNCNLTDRDVLDVGCGRGGTIRLIQEHYDASSTVGVDLSPKAVSFCEDAHRYPNARFMSGDAENLPFDDDSFDVVINIESSHSYPDRLAFYREVRRVLSPDGSFLYADVLPVDAFDAALRYLTDTGWDLERDQDITSNVLASCDDTAGFQFRAFARDQQDQWMANALGVPNSKIYDDMRSGRTAFRITRLRKTRTALEDG